jgi:hypothetical protein
MLWRPRLRKNGFLNNAPKGGRFVLQNIVKLVAVLVAAGILGNWFLTEVKKGKARRKPWYAPYLSPPGLIILGIILLLPIICWLTAD